MEEEESGSLPVGAWSRGHNVTRATINAEAAALRQDRSLQTPMALAELDSVRKPAGWTAFSQLSKIISHF